MEKKRVNITMPVNLLEAVDTMVVEMGMNRSALINFIVKGYMDSQTMIKATQNMSSEKGLTDFAKKLVEMAEEQK